MNVLKSVVKDVYAVTGNLLNVAGVLTTTVSGELVKGTAMMSDAIIATPGVVRAVLTSPVDATVGYIKIDQSLTSEQARALVQAALPESVTQAISQGAEAAGALLGTLVQDDETNTTLDSINKEYNTKAKLAARILELS